MKQAVNKKLEEVNLQAFCQYLGCWNCVDKKNVDIGLCNDHVCSTGSSSAADAPHALDPPGEPSTFNFMQMLKSIRSQIYLLIDDAERREI